MKHALITGANKSIGFETARQLLQKGYHVYIGSRNLENGLKAVEKLKAEGLHEAEAVQLDVNDEATIHAARTTIGQKTPVLDVLINNAGISGGIPQTATGTDIEVFRQVFDTNLFGVIRVTKAFIDLLQAAPQPRIVNVSSSMGSLTLHNNPLWPFYDYKFAAYLPSKTALNMYTVALAHELREMPFKVNMVDPGYIATDFNHHRGTGSVADAGKRLVKYATIGADGPTGRFISEENNPETGEIPW